MILDESVNHENMSIPVPFQLLGFGWWNNMQYRTLKYLRSFETGQFSKGRPLAICHTIACLSKYGMLEENLTSKLLETYSKEC